MHLLYLDDAGSAPNREEDYFVLGGLSVFEAQAHWFTQELDKLAQSIDPGNPHRVDSRASRLVQLADHVAFATYRRYQAGDTQYFDIIAQKFHSEDGVIHGLTHKEPGNPTCMCIACLSRRLSGSRESGGST